MNYDDRHSSDNPRRKRNYYAGKKEFPKNKVDKSRKKRDYTNNRKNKFNKYAIYEDYTPQYENDDEEN